MNKKRGAPAGKRRAPGAGRPPKHIVKLRGNGDVVTRVPIEYKALIETHGLGHLLETYFTTLYNLSVAARNVQADPYNEDAATELEGRIEEATEVLREFRPTEKLIIL